MGDAPRKTPEPPKADPSIHREIGDDKGEGGQQDIKTDSDEAHPPPPPD